MGEIMSATVGGYLSVVYSHRCDEDADQVCTHTGMNDQYSMTRRGRGKTYVVSKAAIVAKNGWNGRGEGRE